MANVFRVLLPIYGRMGEYDLVSSVPFITVSTHIADGSGPDLFDLWHFPANAGNGKWYVNQIWATSGNDGNVYMMERHMWANCGLVHVAHI